MPKSWTPLQQGDCIQLIAPASTIPESGENLKKIRSHLENWGLKIKISQDILAEVKEFPNLANTDEKRFTDLKNALFDPAVKAIWCIRGGYGVIRIMEKLRQLAAPNHASAKLFIGFSDITLLLLFLRQRWGWNCLHGPSALQVAQEKINSEDLKNLQQLIFGKINKIIIDDLMPMNDVAKIQAIIKSEVTGGNLTLISRTLGWDKINRINIKNKILVMEDCDEPFRKVDGILQQMELANYFAPNNKPKAVIIGDFTINHSREQLQVNNALQAFATKLNQFNVPVFRCFGIGHQSGNHPLPIGPSATLLSGINPTLSIESGATFNKLVTASENQASLNNA